MSKVTIATWNVNSLRVRLPQLIEWLGSATPDIVALQETKLQDADFPTAELATQGYQVAFAGQRTYNGVALLAREPIEIIATAIPDFVDEQRRVLAARIGKLTVVNLYVPNGQEPGSEKYQYKLDWLAALTRWLEQLRATSENLVVLGDFNIAPEDRDVHDPAAWVGQVHVSEPERQALRQILAGGFIDVFRKFEQPEKSFSWWDYRAAGFRRNAGLRIDLILASTNLALCCTGARIDREPRRAERPSDHTPVLADFEF